MNELQTPLAAPLPMQKYKVLPCGTRRVQWGDFQQQQTDELSGDCDPAVWSEGLVCCSNLESASEETYLLLGELALALLTPRASTDTQLLMVLS